MGKNRKRKRQNHHLVVRNEDSPLSEPQTDDEIISDGELERTVRTVELLAQNPSSLQEKRYKALRRALHPLVVHQLQSYDQGTDYRIKVTQALQHQKWTDALAGLQGCRDFQQPVKQGTIQRWVRDCDMAPASCKRFLLTAILLVNNVTATATATVSVNPQNSTNDESANKHDPLVALRVAEHLPVVATTKLADTTPDDGATTGSLGILEDWSLGRLMNDNGDNGDNGVDWEKLPAVQLQHPRILYSEKAAERKPPNHYDLVLHTTRPGSIQWSEADTTIRKHEVPFLQSQPGDAFLLENVLTVDECQQLRAAATALGFRPDHPTALERPTGIDSCEWLVDDSILSVLNQRVEPFLSKPSINVHDDPSNSTSKSTSTSTSTSTSQTKKTFYSINPRWRFFRYGQGCVYRPHIDGSWPASRVHPTTGHYECYDHLEEEDDDDDDDKAKSTVKSYHTFLIYLNDNFEGGQTRFYFPSKDGTSSLAAQGISPKCGSVLVFSQGNTASLLHEGSAVTVGTKYVVRTDVLYRASVGKTTTTTTMTNTTMPSRG